MMKKDKQTKHKFALLACVLALAAVLGACGEKEPVFSRQLFQLDNEETVRVLLNEEESDYKYRIEEKENGLKVNTREGDTVLYLTFVTEDILDLRIEENRSSIDELGELGEAKYARLITGEDGYMKWVLYFEKTRIGVTVQSASPELNNTAEEVLHCLSFEVAEGKGERPDPGLEISE